MPVPNYSVLKGDPISGKVVTGRSAHYQINLQTPAGACTVAVNIQSMDGSEVLYEVRQNLAPPEPDALIALPMGVKPLESVPSGLALDFVRTSVNGVPLVARDTMTLLPTEAQPGEPGNLLHNAVVDLLNQAVADPNGAMYAFGSCYADDGQVDGIHDIHMNQGNPSAGGHAEDNGIWQDGALFVNLPGSGSWVGVFIAFQTESWKTDDDGNPA